MEYKPKHLLQGGHDSPVTCVAFSPTGLFVASGDVDGRLVVWSVESGDVVWRCHGHAALLVLKWVTLMCGEYIFCGFGDGSLTVVEYTGGALTVAGYRVLDAPVECMALQTESNNHLATGGANVITVWNASTRECF